MSDLPSLLDRVTDRASFLAFVRALEADRRARPAEWASSTIEDFLEAAFACVEHSHGLSVEPTWRAFATFLYGGKIYE